MVVKLLLFLACIIAGNRVNVQSVTANESVTTLRNTTANTITLSSNIQQMDTSQTIDQTYWTELSMNESDDRRIKGLLNTENLLPQIVDFNFDDFQDISNGKTIEALNSRNIDKSASKANDIPMKYSELEVVPEIRSLSSVIKSMTSANVPLSAGYSFRLL